MVGGDHGRVKGGPERGRRAVAVTVAVSPEPPLTLGALDEVVPATEPLARAGQEQHVDVRIEVRPLDAPFELGHERACDPVAALGAVERQPGDPAGHLEGDRGHTGYARSMIAFASTPAGNVP